MKFPSLRLNLVSKATLCVAAALLTLCALYAYANVTSFRHTSAEINDTRVYDRIRIFAHAVERTVPGSKVEFAKLDRISRVVVPAMPKENDVAIVDAAGDPYGASLNSRDKANGDIVRLTSSVYGPDGQRLKGQRIPGASPIGQGIARGEVVISPLVVGGIPRLAIYVPLTLQSGEVVGAISSGIPMVQAMTLEASIVDKAVIGAAVLLVAALVSIAAILAILLRPLGGLAKSINEMANDRQIDLGSQARRPDEIGIIARALATLDTRLAERRAMQTETVERASGDVAKREALTKAVAGFGESMTSILDRVSRRAGQILDATANVRTLGRSAADGAAETSRATTETAERMVGIAESAEELNSSISEIRRQVMAATDISDSAAQSSQKFRGNVQDLIDAADKIGHVVALIRAIAEQTNLLALNATIEAARAGDAGRGFAVVASEVKELAGQTAKATEDISGQVAAIQAASTGTAEAMDGIYKTIEDVRAATAAISAAVEQQTGATSSIARGVDTTVVLARDASESVAEVAKRVGATEESVMSLDEVSSGIRDDIADVQSSVAAFLSEVKAA